MLNHKCIKPTCPNTYEDEEIDAYYCPSCIVEKNRIAIEIDSKHPSTVGQQPNGLYTQYDKAQKVRGLVRADDLLNFNI